MGYHDPKDLLAYIATRSVEHPAQIELLAFTPNGPTSAVPTAGLPCPRFRVVQAHSEVDWVLHRGPEPMPTGVVLSRSNIAVGESSGASGTIAKFIDDGNRFCLTYGTIPGCQTWGHLMLTTLSYQWEPFQADSDVPYNAFIGAFTSDNQRLYCVMKNSYEYSIGSYNAKTGQVGIQYYGVKRPSEVSILTLSLSPGSSAWTDDGYYVYSGPITAIRIQHSATSITGIRCRFGAQWSAGFWSNIVTENISEIDLQRDEYLRGVELGLNTTMDFIQFHTNLNTFGPFGDTNTRKNFSMFTICGYIHHFSGYLRWDEVTKMNKTFSFAIHAQRCN